MKHNPEPVTYDFECHECKRKYPTKWHLSFHIKKLHQELKCTFCEELFIGSPALDSHVKEDHKDKAIYKCTICTSSYLTQRKLNQHRRNNHLETKCLECDETFAGAIALRSHQKAKHIKMPVTPLKKCYVEGCNWEGKCKLNTHLFFVSFVLFVSCSFILWLYKVLVNCIKFIPKYICDKLAR